MRIYTRSVRSFNVRSDSGSVSAVPERYSSGLMAVRDGAYGEASDDQVIAAALRILSERLMRGNALIDPWAVRQYVALRFANCEHEVFTCLFLDNRHRVIACEELFRGTIDGANVHPREVVKRVLVHNATAVILTHNHPSGVAEPSQSDEIVTRRLKAALALIDVKVLDHLVVGGEVTESMAERGLL